MRNTYGLSDEAERMVEGMREKRLAFFEDGRQMFAALQHLKQYRGKSFGFPTDQHYKDLARSLDLPVSYVTRRVEYFLFNDEGLLAKAEGKGGKEK